MYATESPQELPPGKKITLITQSSATVDDDTENIISNDDIYSQPVDAIASQLLANERTDAVLPQSTMNDQVHRSEQDYLISDSKSQPIESVTPSAAKFAVLDNMGPIHPQSTRRAPAPLMTRVASLPVNEVSSHAQLQFASLPRAKSLPNSSAQPLSPIPPPPTPPLVPAPTAASHSHEVVATTSQPENQDLYSPVSDISCRSQPITTYDELTSAYAASNQTLISSNVASTFANVISTLESPTSLDSALSFPPTDMENSKDNYSYSSSESASPSSSSFSVHKLARSPSIKRQNSTSFFFPAVEEMEEG